VKIFAKRFYGFDPMTRPVIGFGFEADRDALIEASAPGDMIVFVGTMDEPTAQDDRGRLLGIAEFARIPVNAADLIEPRTFKSFELKPDGSLISAKALPMLRAWSLNPKLKLLDVLQEELSVEATLKAVLLNQADSSVVLAIPRIEVTIPRSPMIDRLWVLSELPRLVGRQLAPLQLVGRVLSVEKLISRLGPMRCDLETATFGKLGIHRMYRRAWRKLISTCRMRS
jgi:hypothetical protein